MHPVYHNLRFDNPKEGPDLQNLASSFLAFTISLALSKNAAFTIQPTKKKNNLDIELFLYSY